MVNKIFTIPQGTVPVFVRETLELFLSRSQIVISGVSSSIPDYGAYHLCRGLIQYDSAAVRLLV